MRLKKLLEAMPRFKITANLPEEIIHAIVEHLKGGSKIVTSKKTGENTNILRCAFLKDGVFFIGDFSDSYDKYVVITIIQAVLYDEESIEAEFEAALMKRDYVLIDIQGTLDDATIYIPSYRERHNLESLIESLKNNEMLIYVGNTLTP